jgi:hypothetical protein
MSSTRVKAVAQITPESLEAMSRLISQLSPSATIPTEDEFRQNIGSPAITLLASRTDGILSGKRTREALARARAAGAQTIDLTSHPSREATNHLY